MMTTDTMFIYDERLEKYVGIIKRMCRTILFNKSKEDFEDIVQEVSIKVYKHLDIIETLQEENKFKSWLYKVCKNTCIDYYKTKKDALNYDDCITSNENICSHFPDEFNRLSLKEMVETCVSKLNEEQLTLLRLYLCGHSHEVIKEKLGLNSIGTVKSRISRVKEKVREILQSNHYLQTS